MCQILDLQSPHIKPSFLFQSLIRRLLGSIDPLVDAFNYSNASLDKSSIASLVRRHVRAAEEGAGPQSVVTTSSHISGQNKAQELLSNKLRPIWSEFKYEAEKDKKTTGPGMYDLSFLSTSISLG